MNAREMALDVLLELERTEVYANVLLKQVLDKYDYEDAREKAFLKRLVDGVLEREIQLDYVLDQYSSVPVKKMKPLVRCLMRLSVYQILFLDGVPDAAACNEAVKLAQKRKFGQLKGFVNGVLRSISREKESIAWPSEKEQLPQALSVRYAMPVWMVEKWLEQLGREKTEAVLQGLLEERPVCIRIRNGRSCPDGLPAKPHPYLPYACVLGKTEGIASLPGFAAGDFTVQDVSSMLAVEAAGIRELAAERQRQAAQNETAENPLQILDICAAPGGKTMLAAELAGAWGEVEARDVSEQKAEKILENIERMGLTNVKVRVWDARVRDESRIETADLVLADVPCSGLGVIGRKKDIKRNITPQGLQSLELLQKEILTQAMDYVKPGGVLLYSTCTVNREENEDTADWIVSRGDWERESLKPYLPDCLKDAETDGMLQLLPGIHQTDGFFMARFRKKKSVPLP